MASEQVGELTIKLAFDSKDARAGYKEVTEAAKKSEDAIKQHGTAVSAAISAVVNKAIDAATNVAKSAANVVGDSVKAFGDYEQLVGGVETLFGDAAGAVQQYADKAFETAGLSANDYMETVTGFSARLLQGLGGDTAKAAQVADQAVIDMADNANKMGTSMESIQYAYQGFAKQNYTMLDNLKLGYGGTASEMARLINDSGVLGSTTKVTAETVNDVSFDKIIEAIHTVQDGLGITGTTSKEAATTIQGSVKSMQSAWSNMMVAMTRETGDFAGPVDNLVSSIETALGNVVPALQRAMGGLSQLIAQIGPTLTDMLPGLVTEIVPSALLLLTDVILALIQALPSLLSSLVTAIVDTLPEMIRTIAAAIPPLITELTEAFLTIVDVLTSPDMISALLEAAIELLMAIVDALPAVVDSLVSALPVIIDNITNFFINNLPTILNAAVTLFMAIINALPTIIAKLAAALPTIINSIVNFLKQPGTISAILNAAITVFYALIDALPVIIEALTGALPDIIASIVEFLTNPDTIMMLLDAAVKLFFALVDAVPRILGALVSSFGTLVGNLWEAIKTMFGKFADNFGEFISGAFKGAINGVLSFIESFINTPIKLLNGFLDIINGAFGWLGVNIQHIGLVELPRMEYGGIVPGTSYSGDQNLIRANSGEMVITRQQQASLWKFIENGANDFSDEQNNSSPAPMTVIQNLEIDNRLDIHEVGNALLMEIRRI